MRNKNSLIDEKKCEGCGNIFHRKDKGKNFCRLRFCSRQCVVLSKRFNKDQVSNETVYKIRIQYKSGRFTLNDLSLKYCVSLNSIHKYITRKSRKHVFGVL